MNPKLPTGPSIIADELPPRSWLDKQIPDFPENCNRLDFYHQWLAQHLATEYIQPNPRQVEYLEGLPNLWAEYVMDLDGQSLGYMIEECSDTINLIEASHAHGETWQEFRKRQYVAWEQSSEYRYYDFESEYCCLECTWKSIGLEWHEKKAIVNLAEFPDIPYRFYLAQEIRHSFAEDPITVVSDFLSHFNVA